MITPKQVGLLKELAAHHRTDDEDSAAIIAALNELSALRKENAALRAALEKCARLATAKGHPKNSPGHFGIKRVARAALGATVGSPTDEPSPSGTMHARLNWWKGRCDELQDDNAELRNEGAT